jgi:hypothetical protein
MAKRPAGRAKTAATKRSSGKRKVHRTIPRRPDEIDKNLPVVTEQNTHDPTQLAGNRSDDPWSFPLNSLIRVDWSRRVEMFPHTPGTSRLQSVVYGNRTYDIESLDPRTMGDPDIELLPDCRYYIVPIREEDQSQDAPRRLLLVRRRRDGEKLGPHIWIIGGDDPAQTAEPYATLHIIGNEEDMIIEAASSQPVGVVEAVLKTTPPLPPPRTQTAARSAQPPPPPPPAPPDLRNPRDDQPAPAGLPNEPDPDLLACIDYFHEARAIYTNCGPALTRVQNKFYDYLRDKFSYTVIPIDMGATHFSDIEGHRLTQRPVSSRLVNVSPRVITRVLKDGYKRDQDVKRWAEVVTNQTPITMLRRIKRVRAGRLYVEIETPRSLAIEQLIDEATGHFSLIDGIYAVLALVDSQSSDLNSLAAVLQRYTDSSLPLDQVTNRLYEQLKQIEISHASMRLRYALRDAPRDREFDFIVIGNDKLLDETREIIIRQATRQDGRSYFVLPDVEWLKTRLRSPRLPDDQIVEALARGLATFLGNMAFASGLLEDQVISTIELAPDDPMRAQPLTPDLMTTAVSPYLSAIGNIQAALDRIRRRESGAVIITEVQANPIRVSFSGGRDAVRVIREDVLPWRRDNAWQTDGIKTRRTRMKVLEKEVKTSVTARARMNLLQDEIAGREESLEKNESDLALAILQKNGLDLSKLTKTDKKKWIQSMLPALATIIDSELQITAK